MSRRTNARPRRPRGGGREVAFRTPGYDDAAPRDSFPTVVEWRRLCLNSLVVGRKAGRGCRGGRLLFRPFGPAGREFPVTWLGRLCWNSMTSMSARWSPFPRTLEPKMMALRLLEGVREAGDLEGLGVACAHVGCYRRVKSPLAIPGEVGVGVDAPDAPGDLRWSTARPRWSGWSAGGNTLRGWGALSTVKRRCCVLATIRPSGVAQTVSSGRVFSG